MQGKSRITNLSTRFLLPYKIFIWGVLIVFFLLIAYESFEGLRITSFILPVTWGFVLYRYYIMNSKLHRVEFDDEYLYVIRKEADILVPLENIKDLELRTLIGHYEIMFYNPEQVGDKIYFKPSLLYPFNSKKKDELVNILWQKINKAKTKQSHFQKNALHS
ncbi:MAG: hypothetical protein HYR67_18510 [Bacteroidetes bacterium]|nr:hypothetical protein [Bacteroidota bacterium]